jgi:hypothetical protein
VLLNKAGAKKSQPENRPAPINPITMKTDAKLFIFSKTANFFSIFLQIGVGDFSGITVLVYFFIFWVLNI